VEGKHDYDDDNKDDDGGSASTVKLPRRRGTLEKSAVDEDDADEKKLRRKHVDGNCRYDDEAHYGPIVYTACISAPTTATKQTSTATTTTMESEIAATKTRHTTALSRTPRASRHRHGNKAYVNEDDNDEESE